LSENLNHEDVNVRTSEFTFDRGIPKTVRSHGRIIDPNLLEPGDLLLVCKKQPVWISRKIQQYQEEMFSPEHSCWHHAIVSGGGVEICEAMSTGVRAREYWDYMDGSYELKVRRLKNATPDQRNRLAYYAATMVKTRYGFLNLLGIRDALLGGGNWRRTIFRSQGIICSQLYFEACMRISFLLVSIPQDRVCPAHLSASAQMEDIPLRWIPVSDLLARR
jgi:hypothetical protein